MEDYAKKQVELSRKKYADPPHIANPPKKQEERQDPMEADGRMCGQCVHRCEDAADGDIACNDFDPRKPLAPGEVVDLHRVENDEFATLPGTNGTPLQVEAKEINDIRENEELKPCPFCGSSTVTVQYWSTAYGMCHSCGTEGPKVERVEDDPDNKVDGATASKAWNTRASDSGSERSEPAPPVKDGGKEKGGSK